MISALLSTVVDDKHNRGDGMSVVAPSWVSSGDGLKEKRDTVEAMNCKNQALSPNRLG